MIVNFHAWMRCGSDKCLLKSPFRSPKEIKELRYELQTAVKSRQVAKRRGCRTSQGVITTVDRNWMFTESCFICHEVWVTWLTGQLTEDALFSMWCWVKPALSLSFFVYFWSGPSENPTLGKRSSWIKRWGRKIGLPYLHSSTVPRGMLVLPGTGGPRQTRPKRMFKWINTLHMHTSMSRR